MSAGCGSIEAVPLAFFIVSLIGAAFTFNAHRPRLRQSHLVVPSFFAGWFTTELAVHHLAWQVVATLAFVWAGALTGVLGWIGLAITLVSWAGLIAISLRARHTGEVMDAALDAAFHHAPWSAAGSGAAVPRPRGRAARLVLAWPRRHRDVEVVRNVRYAPGAGRKHCLDVYCPRAGATGAPVLLQIHGGAWVTGDKREQALPLMYHLAARGWVCLSINYRLSPRVTFPDHLVDCKLALRWVREHVADFGGDPAFVAVTGGSAGGHLAALLALTPNDPEYQPGFENVDTRVQACVPLYGIYDFTGRFGGRGEDGLGGFGERVVLRKSVAEDPEAFEKASPISQVRADAPPFFVVHGTHDSLAPVLAARAFADALRAVSRMPVGYAELPGAQHAFEVFHSVRADQVVLGIACFLDVVHRVVAGVASPRGSVPDASGHQPAGERAG